MKKITQLFTVVLMLFTALAFSQSTITGTVMDSGMSSPLPGANIVEKGTTNGTTSDFDGNFSLKTQSSSGEVVISYVGYTPMTVAFSGDQNLGTVSLETDNTLQEVVVIGTGIIDLAEGRETPVAVSTIQGIDIQLKTAGNNEFGESFKNTPSVYVSDQGGGFGDSQIFLRGFDQTNTAYMLNGQPINGMEDGRMYWSNWSGMADVANAVQVQRGLGASKLAISSVGGTVNIVSKTTNRNQGGFVRFMGGNDSYVKTTAGYDSGLNDKGWAFSVLLDHWQAHRKYSVGTAGQGQNYLFSVGYQPNDKNSFNFLLTGAPQWHDQNWAENEDFYKDYGEKANDNYGFLDGEGFSERRNFYHKPIANLNWDLDINDKLDLSTVLYASWGRGGGTGNLGSSSNRIRYDNREINFDQIVENNIASADSNGNGSFGDSYLRRASVNSHNWYGLLSNLNIEASENWSLNVGIDGRTYNGIHFRQLVDGLGLNGYVDNFGVDNDRDSNYVVTGFYEADPWDALFNRASHDERYSYDYEEVINYLGAFGQAEYTNDNFSAFFQGALSTQSYQREGFFSEEVINALGEEVVVPPGKSDKINKEGYNLKGGLSYKINENHSIFGNAGLYSRQPFLDNIFASIRNSNAFAEPGPNGEPGVDNEEILGFEGGYRFKNQTLRLNIDIYNTEWGNRFLNTRGPELDNGDNSTYRLTDVTQIHRGFEFDLEYRPLSASWSLTGYGSIGNWKYEGTTPYTQQNDETSEFVKTGEIELTDVKVGNAPQTSFGVGIDVDLAENLSVDWRYNMYTDLYKFVDPADVAEAALEGSKYESEKIPSYALADAGFTYKFKVGENKVTLRGNVYNLFNEAYINQTDAFGIRLGIGRTFNASLRYAF